MNNRIVTMAMIAFCLILTGCLETFQMLNTATGLYQNAQVGFTAYNSVTMAKDLRDTQPLLAGAEIIRIRADISPRMKDSEEAILAAFTNELVRETKDVLAAIGRTNTVVCTTDCPSEGKMMVVYFREKERAGMVTRVLAGERLTGTTSLINQQEGAVIKDELVEGEDYAGVVSMINLSIMRKLLKEKEGDPQLKEYIEKVNGIRLLSEEGEKALAGTK